MAHNLEHARECLRGPPNVAVNLDSRLHGVNRHRERPIDDSRCSSDRTGGEGAHGRPSAAPSRVRHCTLVVPEPQRVADGLSKRVRPMALEERSNAADPHGVFRAVGNASPTERLRLHATLHELERGGDYGFGDSSSESTSGDTFWDEFTVWDVAADFVVNFHACVEAGKSDGCAKGTGD
eukprot:CAMPEP_0174840900 /NCGR_PEP_ID=MMETSP1114-20130205/8976_1 /TAXON_ID=312471 /ORGANISM="Neobodo designis, Strain CCAP 1951/1" /LENGTH=179 /DNA_ID=CAMNT_0016075067 /DNA_START=115 /DNA_END=654 /DNA_ORIENTATION=-